MIDHPFEGPLDAARCEALARDSKGVPCDRPRAEHRTTSTDRWTRTQQPVHPRDTEIYQATTRIGGIDVAVDAAGCLVLHVVQPGAYAITNLDGFVADLELARAHARQFERDQAARRSEDLDGGSYEDRHGDGS